jgi:hypothetical protein
LKLGVVPFGQKAIQFVASLMACLPKETPGTIHVSFVIAICQVAQGKRLTPPKLPKVKTSLKIGD